MMKVQGFYTPLVLDTILEVAKDVGCVQREFLTPHGALNILTDHGSLIDISCADPWFMDRAWTSIVSHHGNMAPADHAPIESNSMQPLINDLLRKGYIAPRQGHQMLIDVFSDLLLAYGLESVSKPKPAECTGTGASLLEAFWSCVRIFPPISLPYEIMGPVCLTKDSFHTVLTEVIHSEEVYLLSLFHTPTRPTNALRLVGARDPAFRRFFPAFLVRGWLAVEGDKQDVSFQELETKFGDLSLRLRHEERFVRTLVEAAQSGSPYTLLGILPGAPASSFKTKYDQICLRLSEKNLHPETSRNLKKAIHFVLRSLLESLVSLDDISLWTAREMDHHESVMPDGDHGHHQPSVPTKKELKIQKVEAANHFQWAEQFIKEDKTYDGEQQFRLALILDPDNTHYLTTLGLLLQENAHPNVRIEAQRFLLKAFTLEPKVLEHGIHLAKFFLKNGNVDAAREWLEKCRERDPKDLAIAELDQQLKSYQSK